MQRTEIIEAFVLNMTSDDYETFDYILNGVIAEPLVSQLVIEDSEIMLALLRLIQRGLIKAYRLSSSSRYRLDPAHPNAEPGSAEAQTHINWWDFTKGKKGSGGRKGAVPVGESNAGDQ